MSKKLGIIIGGSLLMLTIASCKKDTSWNSAWVVPLINDTLDINKFVNDSTLDASGSNYFLNLRRNLYNFSLTDIVAIPDTTIDRSVALNITSINVNPGFTFYNSIEEHNLNLHDIELKIIQLSGGAIDFELENPVSTGVYVTVELPGVTKNGIVLSKTFFISSGTVSNPGKIKESMSLADYQIDLRGTTGNSFNTLQSLVKIKSDPNGSAVTVTNQDLFKIKAKFRDVIIYYARGYFGQKELQDTTVFNINILNNVIGGAIDIQNTTVKLTLENGIKIDGTGLIKYLKNTNNQNNTVYLSGGSIGNTFTIDQPTGSFSSLLPSKREILFTSGNSNIEQFIENLGAKNEIAYKININPWGNTSGGWNEVYPQSKLKLTLEAQMPLSMKMDNLTIRDTFDFKFEQKKDKSHIESGILQLDLDNAFPFTGKIKLLFVDEYGAIVETVSASQPIPSSLYGQQDSQGLMHQKSTIDVSLPIETVDKLSATKKIIVEASFDTPDPATSVNQMVNIPVNAYLGIKAKARFQLKMKV